MWNCPYKSWCELTCKVVVGGKSGKTWSLVEQERNSYSTWWETSKYWEGRGGPRKKEPTAWIHVTPQRKSVQVTPWESGSSSHHIKCPWNLRLLCKPDSQATYVMQCSQSANTYSTLAYTRCLCSSLPKNTSVIKRSPPLQLRKRTYITCRSKFSSPRFENGECLCLFTDKSKEYNRKSNNCCVS